MPIQIRAEEKPTFAWEWNMFDKENLVSLRQGGNKSSFFFIFTGVLF